MARVTPLFVALIFISISQILISLSSPFQLFKSWHLFLRYFLSKLHFHVFLLFSSACVDKKKQNKKNSLLLSCFIYALFSNYLPLPVRLLHLKNLQVPF
jgi:hypothetical protein